VNAVNSGVKQAVAARGPVDLLIAHAGTATAAPFAKAKPDQFRDMFEQHVLGMVHPVQAVLGSMIERVSAASSRGLDRRAQGLAERVALHHCQHAMVGLVRSIALETAAPASTVNAVCPGFRTDLIRGSMDDWSKSGMSKEERARPFHSPLPVVGW